MTTDTLPQPSGQNLRDILLSQIDVPQGRRELDPDWVATLAEDFKSRPQHTAIDLLQNGERYTLVTGGHRYAAKVAAGHETIHAVVWKQSDFTHLAEVKLVEIAENFMRRELTVLDRAFDVAAWRDVFEVVQGAVKPGRKAKGAPDDAALDEISRKFATNFTTSAQKALKLSRDAVFRALKIARLGESNRRKISLLPIAENQSELLALVAQPSARQAQIIVKLLDGAASVADAIAIIDDVAPPVLLSPFEKMSERFSRLDPAQQRQFFDLHKDAILVWMAEQKR